MPCEIIAVLAVTITKMNRSYSELSKLDSFKDRYDYLRLDGIVGESKFGHDRWINQQFYHSDEWASIREKVIIRDNGCDLGIDGYEIHGRIYIHHINPISREDILSQNSLVTDLDNMICTTFQTHQAIHYGDESLLVTTPIERFKNDTCPWKG